MNIEIELEDDKNCYGCPILECSHSIGWIECVLFGQEVGGFVKDKNNITKKDTVRPQKCIDTFGN